MNNIALPIDFVSIDNLFLRVGMTVRKKSGKPFKSGRKIATIKGFTINPFINRPACTFEEDDSIVNIEILEEDEENRRNISKVPTNS